MKVTVIVRPISAVIVGTEVWAWELLMVDGPVSWAFARKPEMIFGTKEEAVDDARKFVLKLKTASVILDGDDV